MYRENTSYAFVMCCMRVLYSQACLYGQVHSSALPNYLQGVVGGRL